MKRGGSESSAFAQANGVANKELEEQGVRETYVSSYDVMNRRMMPMYANYQVLGGNSNQACAACRWFVSPDACCLVQGDINPGGICDYYLEEQMQVQEPIPVVVTQDNMVGMGSMDSTSEHAGSNGDGSKKGILGRLTSFLGFAQDTQRPPVQPSFMVREVADGTLRWYLRVSNNFTDKTGQIISEAAHKEYVEWADREQAYPELWVWHAKGSRLGEADWLDVSNGVLVASGTIDADRKEIAEGFANDDTIGTSHGFLFTRKDNVITGYRTYELSLLPATNAANVVGGGLNLVEDVNMAFSATKKAFLAERFGMEAADQMEKDTERLAAEFKAAGIEYKEIDEGRELGTQLANLTKAFADYAEATNKALAEVKGGIDAAVEAAMTPRMADAVRVAGFKASDSASTEVKEDDELVAAAKKEVGTNDWFNETVIGAINRGF